MFFATPQVQGAQQEQGEEDLGQAEWRHLVQAEAGLFFVGTMGSLT